MEPEHDYYATLGVPPDADERAIKRAYRQLARQFHPDTSRVAADQQSVEHFRQIQEAYEWLIDPLQREAYDHWRRHQGLDRPPALSLEITLSQDFVPCLGEAQVLYALVKVSAAGELEGQRLPLNLCLVLDRSTSMKGARLQQVKEAARYIVDQMGPDDVLSVVVFSDRAEVVLSGRRGLDKAAARAAISQIQASGGTELLHGLNAGLAELARWQGDELFSSLILLTDGQTYGDEAGCLDQARWAQTSRIPLVTMGVGTDWNEDLLDEMARLSGGSSSYIDSAAKISRAFQEQISNLCDRYAQDLALKVHLGDGVEVEEIFRISPQIAALRLEDDRVALGVLEKQQPQVVLLELLLESSPDQGQKRLLQLEVEGVVPGLGPSPLHIQRDLVVAFTASISNRTVIPPDIVSAMGKLTIFKMQERAMAEVEMGQIDAAVNRLKSMATRLLNIGEAELARAALLEAGNLTQTGSLSSAGRKKLRYGTRGLTIAPKEVRP